MPAKKYIFYVTQNYAYSILRPLQEVILARGDQIAWFLVGNEVNPDYLLANEIYFKSIDEVMKFQPNTVFVPSNIVPNFIPGLKVAVFHGFDAGKVDNRGNNDHFKIRNCFDLYCTQGPSTTEAFLRLAKNRNDFKVTETGWCALDRLYIEQEKLNTQKPTVLLCSTFSKNLSCAPHLFETVKKLSESNKWNWLIQFHPKMPVELVNKYKSIQNENLTFVETDDVIPLLQQADVMVCDTSSVLIMFLLLRKPVVTFKNIDPKDYLLNIEDADLLEESIEKVLQQPIKLMQNIEKFIESTHPYNDGKSSVRVLDAVDELLSGKFPLGKKPLDFVRQMKMRIKLKYWKF